jgi:hypothetical protein
VSGFTTPMEDDGEIGVEEETEGSSVR